LNTAQAQIKVNFNISGRTSDDQEPEKYLSSRGKSNPGRTAEKRKEKPAGKIVSIEQYYSVIMFQVLITADRTVKIRPLEGPEGQTPSFFSLKAGWARLFSVKRDAAREP
jgi:hypothetical protein